MTNGYFIHLNRYQDSIVSRTFISPDSLIVNFQRIHVYQTEINPSNSTPPFQFIPSSTTITYSTYSDTIYKLPAKTIRTNFLPEHLSSNLTSGGNIRLPMSSYKKITDSIYAVSEFKEFTFNYIGLQFPNTCLTKVGTSSGYWSDEFTFFRNVNNSNMYRFQLDPNSLAIYRMHKIDYYFYKDSSQTWGTPLNLKTLSVDDISTSDNPIKIYPNPSLSGSFNLSSAKSIEWDVFDIRGVKLISGKSSQVNLQSYPSGIYLLKVQSNGKAYYSKLVR
jgi:hypothetical protein